MFEFNSSMGHNPSKKPLSKNCFWVNLPALLKKNNLPWRSHMTVKIMPSLK
jgi:hypothetical protein